MLAKLLKRKESRQTIPVDSSTTVQVQDPQEKTSNNGVQQPMLQYRYQRPDLLGKLSENELIATTSHDTRPIISPKSKLTPLETIGYAEVINAGKSRYNEDQACIFQGQLRPKSDLGSMETAKSINYLYIGLFDGHGGPGCAVKASKELQQIVHEGLDDALDHIVKAHRVEMEASDWKKRNKIRRYSAPKINGIEDEEINDKIQELNIVNGTLSSDDEEYCDDEDETREVKMTVDELICGALESAFWAMDKLIAKDKEAGYRISGGSCALVALVILDRLYVANAGDSRACIYNQNESALLPMSYDFTPESDRQRIQLIAYQRPELLRHPVTKEKLYNRHVLSRKVRPDEIGVNTVMYRDFYMAGWSCRDVTNDDVRLVPLITGRGKQCRLLGTVGVARGLGDHDLIVKSSLANCKEFLSCQPEVRVKYIQDLHPDSILVMATDGLWDVLTNLNVFDLTREFWARNKNDLFICQKLAQHLTLEARGEKTTDGYWEKKNGDLASGDDISCLAIPISKVASFINANQDVI